MIQLYIQNIFGGRGGKLLLKEPPKRCMADAEMLLDLADAHGVIRAFNERKDAEKKLIFRRIDPLLFKNQIAKKRQKLDDIGERGNIFRGRRAELDAIINIGKIMIHNALLIFAEGDAMARAFFAVKKRQDALPIGESIESTGENMQAVAIQRAVRQLATMRLIRRNEKNVSALEVIDFFKNFDAPLS